MGKTPCFSMLDAGLPVRSGLDLVKILKKSSQFSHIPVLLVVGSEKNEIYQQAKKSWSEDVVTRPLEPVDLKESFDSLHLERPLSAVQKST